MTVCHRIIPFVFIPTLALLFSACGSGGGADPSPPGAPKAISIQISPDAPTIHTGEAIQFTATIDGSDNLAVTWTVAEENAGSITSDFKPGRPSGSASGRGAPRSTAPAATPT